MNIELAHDAAAIIPCSRPCCAITFIPFPNGARGRKARARNARSKIAKKKSQKYGKKY